MNLDSKHNGYSIHPVSFEQICEHVRNPNRYSDEEFNLDLVNYIGQWASEVETDKTVSSLIVKGLGSVSAATMVMYGVIGEELCISDIEDDIPEYPKVVEIIKTSREFVPGLIFHIEGEYSDEYNVGVWVPEESTGNLIFNVYTIPKKEEKGI